MSPVRQIFEAVAALEMQYPGRKFTPDGIMVGSLGEVRAEELYDIRLLPPNTPEHDAEDREGRLIQIRTNQGDAAYLKQAPDYLLAFKLLPTGDVEEIYNGPGAQAWDVALEVKADANGYHAIRHNKLRRLMGTIGSNDRIARRPQASA